MKTKDRDLPKNIYHSGCDTYLAVIRHHGHRYALGSYATVEEAQAMVDKFRAENPKTRNQNWKPGDYVR